MKAMVLAAGVGERMRPLTDHLPKPLLPIANRPVMGYILAHLARHGFTDVVANTHYLAEAIAGEFGDGADYGVRLHYAYEEQLLGSAGSVKRNQAHLAGDTFLVIGADDLTDMDLTALLSRHRHLGAVASIGLAEVEETSQFGIVVTARGGRIERFVEKPKSDPPSRTANTQIYLFSPAIFGYIPPDQWYDFGFGVFPELVATAQPFYGFALPGYWRDIGSLEQYLDAQEDVLTGRLQASPPGRQVSPGVWMGDGCDVHPDARLEPPLVLGRGCCVGAGAVIGAATAVADGVSVPARTTLHHCVVWEGARVPAGETLRWAVISHDGVLAQSSERRGN